MRLFYQLALLFLFMASAQAADPVVPNQIGTWSNREGAAGGTLSLARYRMGFDDDIKIRNDYLVCNGAKSPVVTFEKSEKTNSPSSEIKTGKCECFEQPEALVFRNSYSVETIVYGTYEAFPAGKKCRGEPLPISAKTELSSVPCEKIFTEPSSVNVAGWHFAKCIVPLPLEDRADYRLCTTAKSIIKTDGTVYGVGNAKVVTDVKLANFYALNTGGQSISQFGILTGDCIDFYQVKQLVVLVGPYPNDQPNNDLKISHANVTLQTIGK